jgi:fermentation-respiration switch protein FrsA (DUF1100 family)
MLFENLIIYPAPRYPDGNWQTERYGCEEVYFASADGTKLHGWYFPNPNARGNLLFCHGNGEHIGYLGPEMAALRDDLQLNVFVFDYRGYGRSAGSPHEAGVLADGQAAQEWLANRAGIRLSDVLLMGRSLGGAVAVHLAAQNGARGLILWNTFSSMPDVAARHFPWLPVHWLLRNRYNAGEKIRNYSGPLLQTHGTDDTIIGFDLAEKLFAAATTLDKQFIQVVGGNHNDLPSPEFTAACAEFIDRVCGCKPENPG